MKKKMILQVIIFAVIFLCGATSIVHADNLICPSFINTEQKIETVPETWEMFTDNAYLKTTSKFGGVAFFDGHPNDRAKLVPNADKKKGKDSIQIWNFDYKSEDNGGFWVRCYYDDTTISLVKKLPDKIKQCSVTYDGRWKNDLIVKSMECH